MSGKIPNDFIHELLVRVDIVDLIDSYVPLKKTGANFVARCPFHQEKTPSFSVNRQKQFYHCFGCGVGGNAISFLMDYNHLNFVEAVEDLAAHAGMTVPRESAPRSAVVAKEQQQVATLYEVLEKIARFYRFQLKTNPEGQKAIAYLKARGVSGEQARDFSLGYAPNEWDALKSLFDKKTLLDTGMCIEKDSGQFYDRFRGRLMYPIRDRRQRVIGFGGRVLDDGTPKYLNSPETPIFSKRREVYGLFELLKKNSKPAQILVVEGYMDVIALAQFDIHFAVATLGTATSNNHIELLFRHTNEIVLCFDGDDAGRHAAWRALEAVFPSLTGRRIVKIFTLPDGEDPDSLVRKSGRDRFLELLNRASDLSEFFFSHLTQSLNVNSIDGKTKLLADASSYLENMPNSLAKDMILQQLKDKTELARLEILKQPPRMQGLKRTPLRVVLSLLIQNPELSLEMEKMDIDWDRMSFAGKDLLQYLLQLIENQRPENTALLLEAFRGTEHETIMMQLANLGVTVDEKDFDDKAEFCGALQRVLETGRKQYIDEQILAKINNVN